MRLAVDDNGRSVPVIRIGVTQKVSFTGTASQSSAFTSSTNPGGGVVLLFATTDCWVKFGADPTATASAGTSAFIPAGIDRYFHYKNGEKISVIRNATSGDLHIIEASA